MHGRRGLSGRRRTRTPASPSRSSGPPPRPSPPPPRASSRLPPKCTRTPPWRWSSRLGLLERDARHLHELLREHALEDDLHVHRVVLEQRGGRDEREVVVVVQQALRERLEPQVALLDRRVPELGPALVLDAGEVRVDVPARRLLDAVDHGREVLGPLQEATLPRVDVREIQDGDDALDRLREREDLVEAPDDLPPAARLEPELRADLVLPVRVAERLHVVRDPPDRLLRLELP